MIVIIHLYELWTALPGYDYKECSCLHQNHQVLPVSECLALMLHLGIYQFCLTVNVKSEQLQAGIQPRWLRVSSGVLLTQVQLPNAARDFFPNSQHSVQILLWCLYSTCVQSHALASAHTLQVPSTESHTTLWTNENTVRTSSTL